MGHRLLTLAIVLTPMLIFRSQSPCSGCSLVSNICAYTLTSLGDNIFKASRCSRCAGTGGKCSQAGALYRFDKEMKEGHLIDPRGEDSSASSLLSSLDSGNEGGSEDGGVSPLPERTSIPAAAAVGHAGSTSAPLIGAAPSTPPETRRSSAPAALESGANSPDLPRSQRSPAPSPSYTYQLVNGDLPDRPTTPDRSPPRAESPSKSVRFALPPSPPTSTTSPTAPVNGASPSEPISIVSPPPAAMPTPTSPTSPTSPPLDINPFDASENDNPKLQSILKKLSNLELRLAAVEGVNQTLRKENSHLKRKNAALKHTVSIVRASHRSSSTALSHAFKIIGEVEQDRSMLVAELQSH